MELMKKQRIGLICMVYMMEIGNYCEDIRMSRAFVIPDIHLKPWMIDKAEERLSKVDYDIIVCLGDLVDDWNQQNNRKLYHETFDAIVAFAKRHQNMFFCYGNHDVSYLWEALETGYSPLAREIVLEGLDALKAALPPENVAYLHRFDNRSGHSIVSDKQHSGRKRNVVGCISNMGKTTG